MNSISRGWLFIVLFALVAIVVLLARGYGGQGDIEGSVDVGPTGTTNPALPYAGAAEVPYDDEAPADETDEDDEEEDEPAPAPTRVTGQPANTVYAAGDQILPLSGDSSDLAAYVGQRATARGIPVQSVVADEGFWVGRANDRIWVQLTGRPPESTYHVERGDEVTFAGEVVAHNAGFADEVGVNQAEGARSLTSQGAHIEVQKRTLALAP
ncbi:hypothetical protein LWF15_29525 [Kineosporia rhizophila]|uniref:hypothetical protein n=1 Tax=Kineosporia TaxID=49184 RepID=UPI001E4F33D3|nr:MULTISPECIES: hypothetical protein [Kineosporia]MCE0539647.1 hypothetical protein [Kineosporia rhizophila]